MSDIKVTGWTRHGHQIFDLAQIGRPTEVARCGGPVMCPQCATDAASQRAMVAEQGETVSKAHHEAVVRGLSATIEAQRERIEEANEARRSAWRDGYLAGKQWAERPRAAE